MTDNINDVIAELYCTKIIYERIIKTYNKSADKRVTNELYEPIHRIKNHLKIVNNNLKKFSDIKVQEIYPKLSEE